jgi:hypothetical protein
MTHHGDAGRNAALLRPVSAHWVVEVEIDAMGVGLGIPLWAFHKARPPTAHTVLCAMAIPGGSAVVFCFRIHAGQVPCR